MLLCLWRRQQLREGRLSIIDVRLNVDEDRKAEIAVFSRGNGRNSFEGKNGDRGNKEEEDTDS